MKFPICRVYAMGISPLIPSNSDVFVARAACRSAMRNFANRWTWNWRGRMPNNPWLTVKKKWIEVVGAQEIPWCSISTSLLSMAVALGKSCCNGFTKPWNKRGGRWLAFSSLMCGHVCKMSLPTLSEREAISLFVGKWYIHLTRYWWSWTKK